MAVLIRLPPDPPQKWKVFQAALEDKDKTRRLCLLLVVNGLPFALLLAALILVVWR